MVENTDSQTTKTRMIHRVGMAYALFTVLFTATIFIASLLFLFSPSWTPYYNLGGNVYFFVLLQVIVVGYLPIILIMSVMVALYSIFFFFIIKSSLKPRAKLLDTPAGFFAVVVPALYLTVLLVTIFEESSGIGIGGSSVSSELTDAPFLAYNSLIYAPFVEEIGFRIIPLGLFSFILVYLRSRSVRDSLYSFISPGRMRKKHGIKMGWIDWTLIIATSLVWGYAHVYFGAWDVGKIATVAITGIVLAIGYIKFGVYVNIPIHWFFNGTTTLYIVYPSSYTLVIGYVLWVLLAGIVGIVLLLINLSSYIDRRRSNGKIST